MMAVTKYRFDDLIALAEASRPVPAPITHPPSTVRSHSITCKGTTGSRFGVWECTPGTWRRQVLQAEFCHFLEGRAVFTPDEGEPIRLCGGDTAYFPKASTGVWEILTPTRKVFIIIDESDGE
jgi:hypothetical protein